MQKLKSAQHLVATRSALNHCRPRPVHDDRKLLPPLLDVNVRPARWIMCGRHQSKQFDYPDIFPFISRRSANAAGRVANASPNQRFVSDVVAGLRMLCPSAGRSVLDAAKAEDNVRCTR